MKVLFTNEAPLIKYGLAEGFRQAGHQIKVIQGAAERLWGQSLNEQKDRIQRALSIFNPDLVITEGFPGFDIKLVGEFIKNWGATHFYWAIEDPVAIDISIQIAPFFDYIFTTTVECLPKYKATPIPAGVMLFGCNPEFHNLVKTDEALKHDLVLIASNYDARFDDAQWFLLPLLEQGYDIKIWGVWWDDPSRSVNLLKHPEKYGGLLPYESLPAVYSSSKIVLGLNCVKISRTQSSMRPYEAIACGGGLYLSPYSIAQAKIFGDSIFQVRSADETIRVVDKILNLPEEERRIRASIAQKLVYDRHSYQLRAEQISRVYQGLKKLS